MKNSRCPSCSHTRKKKTEKCLSLRNNKAGDPYWKCYHCGWFSYNLEDISIWQWGGQITDQLALDLKHNQQTLN